MNLFIRRLSDGPSIDWNKTCTRNERVRSNGTPGIHIVSSPFGPVAIGFFGLATGYFIWDGQALFGFPKQSRGQPHAGLVGFLDAGLMQFLAGICLLTDLVQYVRQSGSTVHGWISLHRFTAFTGSRWHTGDISIPALSPTAGWL
jgi:hypothetical protein